MPTWRSKTPPSRMLWPENSDAVCEATGARGAGARPSPFGATSMWRGEAVVGGVLPASGVSGPCRRRRHRGLNRCGCGSRPAGLLEVLSSAAAAGPSAESQARPPGVLRLEAELAPTHEATCPAPAAAAAHCAGIGGRLKTGHLWTCQSRPFGLALDESEFYRIGSSVRKSLCSFVRQLRGPRSRTCA